jgi:Leucine-rich repeat (LRR) protein
MTQNKDNKESNALVKHVSNSPLVVKEHRSPITLTTDIIKSAIAARQARQQTTYNSWMIEMWKWADKFGIDEEDVPRNKPSLLALASLNLSNLIDFPSVNLKKVQISELPESVGNLINLTRINIDGTQISELPESIGNLTNLTGINLSFTQIGKLPESIGNLINLTELSITGSGLIDFPESIANLTNLASLDINNHFNCNHKPYELPEIIRQLTNLTSLDISSNRLCELPNWVCELTKLTSLNISAIGIN